MMTTPEIISNNENSEYYFDEGCYIWELANSDTEKNLSIARARVLPNTSTKQHKLANTTERYVILEGTGDVILNHQETTHVSKGDVVIIPPNCPQAIINTGADDLVFMVLCTPRFIIENYSECTESLFNPLRKRTIHLTTFPCITQTLLSKVNRLRSIC